MRILVYKRIDSVLSSIPKNADVRVQNQSAHSITANLFNSFRVKFTVNLFFLRVMIM